MNTTATYDQFAATLNEDVEVDFDVALFLAEFASLMRKLRGSADRSYEDALTRWVTRLPGLTPEHLLDIALEETRPANERFAAYYGAHILARRLGRLDRLPYFGDRPEFADGHDIWFHLASMYQAEAVGSTAKALRYAVRAYESVVKPETDRCQHAGVVHNLASRLLDVLEQPGTSQRGRPRLIEDTLRYSQEAIELDPEYAKFHATRARALCVAGRHDEALDAIRSAIQLHRGAGTDHVARRLEYQSIERQIQIAIAQNGLDSVVDGIRGELNSVRAETLQMAGLLAGVVGLVIAAVQVTVTVSPTDSVATMLAVAGTVAVILMAANASAMRRVTMSDRVWALAMPTAAAAVLFLGAFVVAR